MPHPGLASIDCRRRAGFVSFRADMGSSWCSDYDKRFVVVVYGVTCNVCLRCDKVPGHIRASAVFAELREL
jgi:hypothetical protein